LPIHLRLISVTNLTILTIVTVSVNVDIVRELNHSSITKCLPNLTKTSQIGLKRRY
jgi:hypothetical protein